MASFFTKSELSKVARKKNDVSTLMSKCNKCGLHKQCDHPKIKYSGKGKKKILVIGGSPTKQSDIYGKPFIDEGGNIIKEELAGLSKSINLKKDCWSVYAVPCYSNKEVSRTTVKQCRPRIQRIIKKLKPNHIILFGEIAIQSILGNSFKYTYEERWRGISIPDYENKCWIHCMLDPYKTVKGESKQKDNHFNSVLIKDFQNLSERLEFKPVERKNYEDRIKVITQYKKVITALKYILSSCKKIAFDYETTGLKPYVKGHKIVSISIAINKEKAIAFPFDHTDIWTKKELLEIRKLWLAILKNKKIKKIAHNSKFEDNWSAICIGSRPLGWYWDTQNAAHIIDNRSKYTKLKFQTFINFGIRPYDNHISPFLSSNGEEFNSVEQADLKELLLYNGFDSLFTFMLYERQKSFLSNKKGMIKAMSFFDKGNIVMGEIQLNGIRTDEEYYKQQNIKLKKEIKRLHKRLTKGREAKKFKKKFGRELLLTSNPDIGKLVYEILGKTPQYTNEKRVNYKTDKNTLKKLMIPFIEDLIKMKELEKARTTNLKNFIRESYKGVTHPFFSLTIPVSYRSSSYNPNFQNIPKRLPEIAFIIRKGLIPSPGNVLGELDFSGAEVITSVCYHKDPTFFNYLTDPDSDMHRDNACDLWLLSHEQVTKTIRFFAKNLWTFAQFYGDWYGSCAPNLWETCLDLKTSDGITLKNHMMEQGISDLDTFLELTKQVEDKLWNERFPKYTEWKDKIVQKYLDDGYIETYLGFVFQGLMSRNQCCNYPIQGTSFHMLVHTLYKISKFLRKNKLKTKLIGQIHDSIISDGPKEEWEFYVKGVQKIVRRLQKEFNWLIIPMEIESEVSLTMEKGGSLAEMYEYDNGKIKIKNENNEEIWEKFDMVV